MDIKLELVAVPVTDVDRAKAFYEQVGFHVDHDHTVSDDVRFVQLTPPGSACSIAIGKGLTGMVPGSLDNMQAVVADIEEARADLVERGMSADEIATIIETSTSPEDATARWIATWGCKKKTGYRRQRSIKAPETTLNNSAAPGSGTTAVLKPSAAPGTGLPNRACQKS